MIKYLVFIRACGAVEPCLFVASFFTMFTKTVSAVHPTFQRHIFLHNMESIRIISMKDIWKIRRGGQSTNRIFIGNRDGSWEQIWSILGSFMWGGSIINGDGRCIHSWDKKIRCKGIIESVINYPVVIFQCWNFLVQMSFCNTMTVQDLPIYDTHTQFHCIASIKYPLYITKYLYSAISECRILLWFSIALQALQYLPRKRGQTTEWKEALEKISGKQDR